MRFSAFTRTAATAALLALLPTQSAFAWGRDGHMMINKLAAQYLPADVPSFLRNANGVDVMEWMGPEPDRWKQRDAEAELVATQSPDHFLDYEWAIYGATKCDAGTPDCVDGYKFPRKRYDYIRALTAALPQHPEIKTAETVGYQPWQVEEVWERLKSDFREYRKLVAANQDTAPVQNAILFDAGWLGHYVADGSQPLHLTIQYNGWTGPNPNGYAVYDRQNGIHSKFESVYVSANIKAADVAALVEAAPPTIIDDEWTQYMQYLAHSHALVEKVYQLDKAHGFDAAGTPEAKAFTEERLAAGAIELRDLIASAWKHSADPVQEYRGPQ
ncbi:MAG: S1/P1 nuclease [Acidobacteriota bacterium]